MCEILQESPRKLAELLREKGKVSFKCEHEKEEIIPGNFKKLYTLRKNGVAKLTALNPSLMFSVNKGMIGWKIWLM